MKRVTSLFFAFQIGCAAISASHDPGLSSAEVRLGSEHIVAHLVFSRSEIEALGDWTEVGESALEIALDGRTVAGRLSSVVVDASEALHLEFVFAAEPATRLLVRSPLLAKLARGHRQYVTVLDRSGTPLVQRVIDAENPIVETPLSPTTMRVDLPSSFAKFVLLGLEHIITGYDHLLFLLGVLVVGGGLTGAVRIITSFTIAHSITLVLATFDWLRVPPAVVEPLIAASILYVGLENLLRRNPKRRSLLTFVFGLVHGLGFASVLRELGIGAMGGSAAIPLVAFNLGVETGQIAVAAIVLPVVWQGSAPRPLGSGLRTVCSFLVAVAGAFWLWQRTLG